MPEPDRIGRKERNRRNPVEMMGFRFCVCSLSAEKKNDRNSSDRQECRVFEFRFSENRGELIPDAEAILHGNAEKLLGV